MSRPDGVPAFAMQDPQAAQEAIAHCFGCGPENPQGLHVQARRDGAKTVIEFQGSRAHAGWDTVFHGGILATLIDEAAGFAMFDGAAQFGMTRQLMVRYRRRAHWTRPVRVEAMAIRRDAQRAVFACRLLQDGQVCAEGEVEFQLLPGPPPREG